MASKDFIAWVERQAQNMRQRISLDSLEPLDPFQLAKTFNVIILSSLEKFGFPTEITNQLLNVDPDSWSAGTMPLPDGRKLILMNPTHPLTRRRATLMEELAHIYLNHKPGSLLVIAGLLATRKYKKTYETEAYWVGAAALVTSTMLRNAQANHTKRRALAHYSGVSLDLVNFRERITGIHLQ